MNLSHDDHTTSSSLEERDMAAVLAPHDIGTPCMTLIKGWICDWYSLRTIEFFGATANVE